MFKHDLLQYDISSSTGASRARDKLDGIIQRGRANTLAVIDDIANKVIYDEIVDTNRLSLTYDDDGDRALIVEGRMLPIHDFAFSKLLSETVVGKDFYNNMTKEAGGQMWGKRLVANAVNEVLEHREQQRNMIRIEGGENGLVKGFLSDAYRRIDSRPVANAFIGACQELDLLPIEGVMLDTKMRIRAVFPHVFEPARNQVMIFGAELGNSDYGDGKLTVKLWNMLIQCTNLGVIETVLEQVHLGGRLPENILFSQETYRKDAELTALSVRDVVSDVISPKRIHRVLNAVNTASEERISGREAIKKVVGTKLGEVEREMVTNLFESPDVVNMPEGDNKWRLSNAITWFAQNKSVSPDRKLELQEYAGEMIGGKQKANTIKQLRI